MTAYVVLDIDVTDPDTFSRYRELAPVAIEAFGGRYLARGGRTEVLEGVWKPKRIVVLEFPSVQRAKAWLDSTEYREARALRNASTVTHSIVTEGV